MAMTQEWNANGPTQQIIIGFKACKHMPTKKRFKKSQQVRKSQKLTSKEMCLYTAYLYNYEYVRRYTSKICMYIIV